MVSFLISAIKIIFLLGFLIFIHESGHFLVAKACKIKVKEFAIGFGPTIWKKQGKETKYALRLIPLGGFVNMLGEEERSNEEGSFSTASIPKRIAVVLAGGAVNIIFGLLVYFILVSSSGNYISNIVDSTLPNYSEPDLIFCHLKVKDKKSNGNEVLVTVKRNDDIKEIKVIPTKEETKSIGIYLEAKEENLSSSIKGVYSESPAEKAGLQAEDKIVKIDGIECKDDPYKVIELISSSTNEKMLIEVERNNQIKNFEIEPQTTETYKLGIIFKVAENTFANNIYYGFWDTTDFSVSIIDNLKMLFKGEVKADQLMGPVGISEVVSKTDGIVEFIYMLALISLSLGVTNLLPFPPLDGGKIVILIIEAIRRKPMKENIEVGIQMAGFCILIGLSIFVTYNDILRIF